MPPGARAPKERDALFEDACVLRDATALAELFEPRALFAATGLPGEVRGGEAIARSAAALWSGDLAYVAGPRRVMQAHDIALVLAAQGISVVRRGADGAWRYAISLPAIDQRTKVERWPSRS